MSEHRLPDDLNQWPHDPYALLGVDADADRREVRRAYVRLLRRFRPDTHPQHFQRIRGAYELISAGGEQPEFDQGEEPSFAFFPTDGETGEANTSSFAWDDSRHPLRFGHHGPAEAVSAAWQLAQDGDPVAAYRRLASLAEQAELAEGASLRLYWLLTAMPDIPESKTCHDWLASTLRASRLTGPAMVLLRRLLVRNPRHALTDAYTALLDCEAAPGSRLHFFEMRWQALSALRLPERILEDLDRLGSLLREASAETWGHALCLACTQLLWLPSDRIPGGEIEALRRELEEVASHHPSLHEALFHLDLAVETSRDWRRLRNGGVAPKPLLDFVFLSATQSDPVVQTAARELIDRFGENGEEALAQFDRIVSASPIVMSHLDLHLRMATDFLLLDGSGLDDGSLAQLSRLFLANHPGNYATNRGHLLLFCLREGIAVHEITPWLDRQEAQADGSTQPWKLLVEQDLPLQCTAFVCRQFRRPVAETPAYECE